MKRHPIVIASIVAGAMYMEFLDATVIATALPQMGISFGIDPTHLSAGISSYMLALAVFIPISGWVADRFGSRTVFGSAIVVFTAASILCGFSNSLLQFTAARILQGIGGAMMVPVGRLVVLHNTEKKDLMRAIACITWPGLLAPVIGPPLGGFITTYSTWRWIFFLNVPLGLIGIVMVAIFIPNERSENRRALDGIGFLLSGAACTALMYGVDLIGRNGAPWTISVLVLTGGFVLGTLAVRHVRRHPSPLLDLSLLKIPTYAVMIWSGSLSRIAIAAMPFLLPLLFQVGFGLSAFRSGLLVLALFAGNVGMKLVTTPLLRWFGFRTTLIVNGMLMPVTILACAFLTPATPHAWVAVILFVGGLCRSMQFTSLNTIGFADVPRDSMSSSSTFFSMVQQMGLGLGVALGAVALQMASWLNGRGSASIGLAEFKFAFILSAILPILSLFQYFSLRRDAGAAVSGHGWPETATANGPASIR